jgi:hypothetical protein
MLRPAALLKNRFLMTDIRADLSQYYAAKGLFEKILGRAAFMRVKDYGPLSAWRENYTKLLRAVRVAAEATVEVADAEWKVELSELLTHGIKRLTTAKSIDELHAAAAATLGELAFLQLGFVPKGHCHAANVPLIARNWKMSPVRTVQYVQSAEQRAAQKRLSKSKVKDDET